MDAARSGGIWESLYRVVMRRNSVYVTFVIVGAFAGERAVDYGVHKLWEYNNLGYVGHEYMAEGAIQAEALGVRDCLKWASRSGIKRYEDIAVLGQRPSEE